MIPSSRTEYQKTVSVVTNSLRRLTYAAGKRLLECLQRGKQVSMRENWVVLSKVFWMHIAGTKPKLRARQTKLFA
jgi:hypothetical protein